MKTKSFLVYTSLIILMSCTESKVKRIIVDDTFAEGEISVDNIFNGHIKFYDTLTKKLIIEADYLHGKLEGKRTDYYLNGKLKNIGYYEAGKNNGTTLYYDSSGKIIKKQDFFYGLKVGSTTDYKDGKVSEYYFNSFENEELFFVDYDSIYNVPLKDINKNHLFFFHINKIIGLNTIENKVEKIELFLYLINPPDFNFQYSLCKIDNRDSILQVENNFSMSKPFETFIIDPTELKPGERFTLKLSFERHLNEEDGEKGFFLKRL